MVFGAAVLAVILASLLAPKAAHALVATLVQVTNTSANPVPTVATDNPALQPFQWSGAQSGIEFSFSVPTGKTLVIEQLSVHCYGPPQQGPFNVRFGTTAEGAQGIYSFPMTAVSTQWMDEVLDQMVRVYADGGSTVFIESDYGLVDGSTCAASVGGHLVNHP